MQIITIIVLFISTIFVYSQNINQECQGNDCFQLGLNSGIINIDGGKVQIGINNGRVNITYLGDPKDKELIKNYNLKINNLNIKLNEYLTKINKQEKRQLSDNEKIEKATKYAEILMGQIDSLNNLISQLGGQPEYLLRLKSAQERWDVPLIKRLLEEYQNVENSNIKVYVKNAYVLADFQKADLEYEKAYSNYKRAVTFDTTNSVYLNRAGVMAIELGKYNDAIIYLIKNLKIDISKGNINFRDIFRDYSNLGIVYKKISDFQKANEYYILALSIKNIPPADIATVYNNLGTLWHALGDYTKADSFLVLSIKNLNTEDSLVARYFNNLGAMKIESGKINEALQCYFNALKIDSLIYKYYHPYLASDFNNIGLAYKIQGDTSKALFYFQKSLNYSIKVYGKYNELVATCCNNIALLYDNQNNPDSTFKYQQLTLTIDSEILPKDHPNITRDLSNLIGSLIKCGMFLEAKKIADTVLAIDLKKFEPNHPIIATDQNNLGVIHEHLRNY